MSTLISVLEMGNKSIWEHWKNKILSDWEKSKKFPRKQKKRVRKELLLDWNFASYNSIDDQNK